MTKTPQDILRQWREIIHMAWHLADDSEHSEDFEWQRLYEALDDYQEFSDSDIHPQINEDLEILLSLIEREKS